MPNKKGGKKFKKGKKQSFHDKKLIYKDPKEDQEYGKVVRAMGNGRFEIQCFDGKDRMGIIAGNMRKKIWVNKDDIILFCKWEFTTDDNKCSIIHKYDQDEVKKLQREGEFPIHINLESESEFNEYNDSENMISFNYDVSSEDDSDSDYDSDDDDESKDDKKDKLPVRIHEGVEEIDFNDI